MKNPRRRFRSALPAAVGGVVAALLFSGCELDSAERVRQVSLQIAGLYRNPNGNLVERNSGAAVARLTLTQSGDQLTGVDNNGVRFQGRITQITGNRASIFLEARTTAGGKGQLAGDVLVSGTSAVLRGTWTESGIFSAVQGEATVQGEVVPPKTNAAPQIR